MENTRQPYYFKTSQIAQLLGAESVALNSLAILSGNSADGQGHHWLWLLPGIVLVHVPLFKAWLQSPFSISFPPLPPRTQKSHPFSFIQRLAVFIDIIKKLLVNQLLPLHLTIITDNFVAGLSVYYAMLLLLFWDV